ncbi:MAG: fumarylacetoacetate hydrolase family protein [Actinomycetota bacterium]|nr:fumarylacetoacetate hydrolase family protein [Actinomycetota bacterium]
MHLLPDDATVLDLVRAGLPAALEAGERALAVASVPVSEVRLRPPLRPPSVRDFFTFEAHVEGARRSVAAGDPVPPEWYDAPVFYFTNPHTLVGDGDDVAVPPGCALLDFELEVAAVVARDGRDLSPEQAREHVFGYTIFNDWSARDVQRHEMRVGLGPSKGKDFAGTLGPWIVTADELEPARDDEGLLALAMSAQVNGVEVGRDVLSHMAWTFEELLAHASRGSRVVAGDVVGSGTCGGGGCLAEMWGRSGTTEPPPLRPGDVVTLTVERIGSVTNRVVTGPDTSPVRPARRRSAV